MDRTGIPGIVLGLGAIVIGLLWEGGSILSLLEAPAFIIVFGGTLGAVLLQTPYSIFQDALRRIVFVIKPPQYPFNQMYDRLLYWSESSRQHGLLYLENELDMEPDPFVKKGLTLLVDGASRELIQDTLDMHATLEREKALRACRVYESMGGYSPTIGIIGAVLGLMQAMTVLDSPDQLGAGIATAFVATIYGVGFANLIYLPVANKLRFYVHIESDYREMVTEGLLAIHEGENPRNLRLKLQAFLEK